jgi:hypothetical protein
MQSTSVFCHGYPFYRSACYDSVSDRSQGYACARSLKPAQWNQGLDLTEQGTDHVTLISLISTLSGLITLITLITVSTVRISLV